MKKSLLLPLIISIVLSIIPFFWLKPGWMDLGGDSSRLYFYDPINYLKSFPLYVIAPTGTDVLMIGHYLIPFVMAISIFNVIFNSPYLTITIFNSFQLVVAFLSVYGIVLLLLKNYLEKESEAYINLAAIASGVFYVLSPFLAPNGWDKAMFIHHQFFLNPFMFLLLLFYINTKKIAYLLTFLLTSFVFAANFSPSPSFFSFYPLAILYLFLYVLVVKRGSFNFKHILLIFSLFVIIHLFHLIPQGIVFLTDENSAYRQAAFSREGKIDRGQGYFTSIAQTYKFANNITGLPQGLSSVPRLLEPLWFIMPLIFIFGLFLNKSINKEHIQKSNDFLLLFAFFLLTLFLVTARVTDVGFEFYKSLFNIPGFSMFRNFLGQFSFLFIFFYSLIFGYCLFYIFNLYKRTSVIFFCLIIALIVSSSWPFIKGDMINIIQNKGARTEVGVAIKMDPTYEEVLKYIRSTPFDGKFLSLPFTEGGLQILAGRDGGAYQGPSMISYLTQKVDFAGRSGLYPFAELFLRAAKNKEYESLNNIFSLLNIKYIFYNSDPYIFSDNFYRIPPYQEMQKYLPTTQKTYKIFLDQLAIDKKNDFGQKYHLYEVNKDKYLPHIYAGYIASFNKSLQEFLPPLLNAKDRNIAFVDNSIDNNVFEINASYFQAKPASYYLDFFKNSKHTTTVSSAVPIKLYSPLFPLLVLPQKAIYPSETIRIYDTYFDNRIYQAENLISDVEKKKMQLDQALSRYERILMSVAHDMKNRERKESFFVSNEGDLKKTLIKHENRIDNWIKKEQTLLEAERISLVKKSQELFDRIHTFIDTKFVSKIKLYYTVNIPSDGIYEVFLKRSGISGNYQKDVSLVIDNNSPIPDDFSSDVEWMHFEKVKLQKNNSVKFILTLPQFISGNDAIAWSVLENRESGATIDVILSDVSLRDYIQSIINNISEWKPNTIYLLSFDYRSVPDNNWKTYRAILESSDDGKSALLQIIKGDNAPLSGDPSQPPNIDIRKLSVITVPYPDIILRTTEARHESILPTIIFTKINPTKYKIKVKGAIDPYALVFLEAFHKDWKLFLSNNEKKENTVVASYFNDKVKEGHSKNIFLDENTFEVWRTKPILEETHFMANGYANAWHITPQKVNGKTDYALILEMTVQRAFYISLFISLVGILVCLVLLGVVLLKIAHK